MPDDRAAEPSAEAWRSEVDEADLWFEPGSHYAAARTWGVIMAYAYEKSSDTACDIIAHVLNAFAAQAVQRALAEVRQIIDDVSAEGDASDPNELNWINACTAIDNRVRELIVASPPRPGIEQAVRRAIEQERERIYKAAEIRWLPEIMEAVRRDLLTPD